MKKILAVVIASVLMITLCVSASANLNIDRLFVNHNEMAGGEDVLGQAKGDGITINAGEALYILGWAANEAGELTEIVYSVNGGENISCPDNYRDRPDVVSAGIPAANNGAHAGFGHDNASEGGLLELTGTNRLSAGEYEIVVKAVYADGSVEEYSTFYVTVEGELPPEETQEPEEPAPTSDAAIIAVAALGCIALAGVVVAKKVK